VRWSSNVDESGDAERDLDLVRHDYGIAIAVSNCFAIALAFTGGAIRAYP
jgi:hypothetical protein